MSKSDDDRRVLIEYQNWAAIEPERTIDEYLREREDRENTRRVADALDLVDEALQAIAANAPDSMPAEQIPLRFREIRDVLTADREFVDDITLAGSSERTYL